MLVRPGKWSREMPYLLPTGFVLATEAQLRQLRSAIAPFQQSQIISVWPLGLAVVHSGLVVALQAYPGGGMASVLPRPPSPPPPVQTTSILDLPQNDVMPLIFKHLDFDSRLAASAVCRQWNELIWADRRFRERTWIRLYIYSLSFLDFAVKTLTRSTRRCPNLRITFCNKQELMSTGSIRVGLLKELDYVRHIEIKYKMPCVAEDWDVVNYRLLHGSTWLESLTLDFPLLALFSGEFDDKRFKYCKKALVKQKGKAPRAIGNFLDMEHLMMPSLTTLRVHPPLTGRFQHHQTWVYPSPACCYQNVTHLEICVTFEYQMDLVSRLREQLLTLVLIKIFPEKAIPRFKELRFPRLRRYVQHAREYPDLEMLENGMPRLEELNADGCWISKEGLARVISKHPQLREFGAHLPYLTEGDLAPICRLTELRKLTLRHSAERALPDFFADARTPLANLEHLVVWGFFLAKQHNLGTGPSVMPNVTRITLRECTVTDDFMDELYVLFPALTELKIHYVHTANVTAFEKGATGGATCKLARGVLYGDAWRDSAGVWHQRVLGRGSRSQRSVELNAVLFPRLYRRSRADRYRVLDATRDKLIKTWRRGDQEPYFSAFV